MGQSKSKHIEEEPEKTCNINMDDYYDDTNDDNCIMKLNDKTTQEIANLILEDNEFLMKQTRKGTVKVIFKNTKNNKEYKGISHARFKQQIIGNVEVPMSDIIEKLKDIEENDNIDVKIQNKASIFLINIYNKNIPVVKAIGGRRKRRKYKKKSTKRRKRTLKNKRKRSKRKHRK